MPAAPLFSIVTITRNNLKGIKQTYSSLSAQSFAGYEWIVIDGASDDGTQDWLSDLALPGQSSAWISEADGGIYDAMNKGLARVGGTYILFLNAGDQLASDDVLQRLSDLITAQDNPDFIYGDALEEVPDEARPFMKRARDIRRLPQGMITHHQAMVYKREGLTGLRYDTGYSLAADYDLTLRFVRGLGEAGRSVYFAAPLCIFEAGGVSQRQAGLARREEFQIRRRLGTCSLPAACLIWLRQWAAHAMKCTFPNLYYGLRASGG